MCGLVQLIIHFFKKKEEAGSAHEALELGQISHPYDVRRVDSKGNPIDSQDHPLPNNLPVTDPVVTSCFASTRGGRPNLDAVAIFRGLPIPDGSAVTDGTLLLRVHPLPPMVLPSTLRSRLVPRPSRIPTLSLLVLLPRISKPMPLATTTLLPLFDRNRI
ncbi:hypothetical protein NXS19_000941 [Fusarium pseudograminearum]|nr:hypothetical protein NXS19_000941 [Fusarium pseudograminearum]